MVMATRPSRSRRKPFPSRSAPLGSDWQWPARITFDFSSALRLNINVGAQYYAADPRGLFATAGAGLSWNFVKQWSVISEVFALMGPGQSNPRFQSGIRYSPTNDIDCDLIYGRNLTGEGANWITLALTVRIGDN